MAAQNSILVLDDSPSELSQLREVCARLGLDLRPAATVDEAVRTATGARPLAAVVGLASVDDCEEGVRHLRARKELAGVPLLAFGAPSLDDAQRAFVAGADDHVSRPIDAAGLGAKLGALRDAARLPPAKAVDRKAKKVLVADDDLFFRQRSRDVLEAAGFQVTEAASGLEVMKLLDADPSGRPDLVLLDVFMPGLGGLELVRAIRDARAWSAVPIVVVSGARQDPALRTELLRLEVRDFVDKYAVTIDRVLPIVEDYLAPGGTKRRASPRAPHFALCEFRRQAHDAWQAGFVCNLSASGVFVRTVSPPPREALVDARMDLGAGATRVLTKARVAWVNEPCSDVATGQPCGMGLAFGELPVDACARIAEIVGT